jgi:hypothetical protein
MTPRLLLHIARHPQQSAAFLRALRHAKRAVPIISASVGRVGSTLVSNALVRGRARDLLGYYQPAHWRLISDTCWDLDRYRSCQGTVCKTHDFPFGLAARHDAKIVFLHGRPSDVVLSIHRCISTQGRAWVADHFRHMHAVGDIDELFLRDVMRIEEQIDAWRSVCGRRILCLSYDSLWDHVDVLSDFVGFPVVLPLRRDRKTDDLDPAIVTLARSRFARLDAKVAALPSCEIIDNPGEERPARS